MRYPIPLTFILLAEFLLVQARDSSDESLETDSVVAQPALPMPSQKAIELVGVQFIDALIKKGQVEMAKGAFRTQLDVLEKVHPEQYQKYKKMSIDELAADAVLQQAEMAKLQPKTGNPFVDMLNENGIPIASSLKGIEQAIKTQKEIETQDPSEQIAKAVLEKFQKQILPGLVANMIAGRNPFKIPQQMRHAQAAPSEIRRQALESANHRYSPAMHYREKEPSLEAKLRSSPRLRELLRNPEIASALSPRLKDSPLIDDDQLERKVKLDEKSALVLGLHDLYSEEDLDDEETEVETNSIRRSPFSLPSSFVHSLERNSEVKRALEQLTLRVNDVEKYLEPKPLMTNPKPQPGYFVPRKIPTRPRKMLPLLIGLDKDEEREIRRSDNGQRTSKSRVITNLQNNPNIAPLFMNEKLEPILVGRQMLTDEQKGKTPFKTIKAYPRLFGSKTHKPIDAKVFQMIEERPVPPLMWTPKGRHTRLRWTGATEKEIPGLGGRFILPSLDPTMPALNTAYSTQGRARDEWDSTFKIPNAWAAGDEAGFSVEHKSRRFIGGNGGVDMPALGL